MNIQQNLNALLTMGAVAARASHKYDINARYAELEKKKKAYEKATEITDTQLTGEYVDEKGKKHNMAKEIENGGYKNPEDQQTIKKHLANKEALAEIAEEMSQLKPTNKSINAAEQAGFDVETETEYYEGVLAGEYDKKKAKAEKKLLQAQQDEIEQKRAQRQQEEERIKMKKQQDMKDVLAAARKIYGGK